MGDSNHSNLCQKYISLLVNADKTGPPQVFNNNQRAIAHIFLLQSHVPVAGPPSPGRAASSASGSGRTQSKLVGPPIGGLV